MLICLLLRDNASFSHFRRKNILLSMAVPAVHLRIMFSRLSFILSSLIGDTKDTSAKVDSSQRILCKHRAQVPGSEQT